MANYYGTERTNYFRVKDEDAFRKWAEEELEIEVVEHDENKGMFCLLPDPNGDDRTFPVWRESEDEDEDLEEIDFMGELSKHLQPGSVAVRTQSGFEKLRYVMGFADAINHKGERVSVDIQDIYRLAAEAKLGDEITDAAY